MLLAKLADNRQESELGTHTGSDLGEACREIESLYQAYPGTVFRLNGNGIILGYKVESDSPLRMEPGSRLGRRLSEVLPAEIAADLDEAVLRATNQKQPQTFQCEYNRIESKSFCEVRIQPTADGGTILCIQYLVARETEEEHELEDNRRIRVAFDNTTEFFGLTSLDGTLLEVNQTALRFSEAQRAEVIGRPFCEGPWWTHSPELQDKLRKAVRSAADGVAGNFEVTHVAAEGSTHWVDFSLRPVKDGSGRIIFLVAEGRDVTDRKLAEKALHESRELLHAVLDSIPIRVFWKDRDLKYLGCNTAFANDAGFETSEEMIGKSDSDLIWADEAEKYRSDDQEVIESGKEKLLMEEPQTTTTGDKIWLLTSKVPLRDTAGKVCGVLGTYYDITEKQVTERKLEAHAAELRSALNELSLARGFIDGILNAVVDPIYVKDEDRRYILVNDSLCRFIGRSREEIVGEIAEDLFLAEEADAFRDSEQQVFDTGQVLEIEESVTDCRGEVHETLTKTSLYCNHVDGKRYLVGVARDITERKKLETQRDLMSAAVESAAEVVVVTDTAGRIEYANSAFERVSGYSRSEVIGENAAISQSGNHDSSFYKELWSTIKSGNVWKGQLKNKRKDGSLYDEEATISPLVSSDGLITNFVAVKRDITQELNLERQLRQSQKLEAIGTLAGGIAHDFNNMLTAIIGQASLLQTSRKDDAKVLKASSEIINTGNRAATLTRQLLSYARTESVNPTASDLNDRLLEATGMLKRLIGDDLELLLDLSDNLKKVSVDSSQLDQVVLNLVVNARDAMSFGGTIRLETASRSLSVTELCDFPGLAEGEYVMLRCWDTGSGMTPEVAARIFDPFYTTKEQGKGTGLGLSTVYGIVRQAKGFIGVKSERLKGTCFTVLFPVASEELEVVAAPPTQEVRNTRGSGTILLAEEDQKARSARRQLLESKEYEVLEALTVEEAIVIAQNWPSPINLLLVDAGMLGLNGQEIANRAAEAHPGISVLFMTGLDDDSVLQKIPLCETARTVDRTGSSGELLQEIRSALESVEVA